MNPTLQINYSDDEIRRSLPDGRTTQSGCVLLVDDDPVVRRGLARLIRGTGHRTLEASSAKHALEVLEAEEVDVLITDLSMPDLDGFDLLQRMRTARLEIPVLFMTGNPSVDTAARAVAEGAFRYLVKPVPPPALRDALDDAVRTRALLHASRQYGQRSELEDRFQRALDSLEMHVQPILAVATRACVGFEVLMRSREPSLPHPGAVLDAAQKLGTLHVLGRRVRALTATVIDAATPDQLFFVNLHPADLADSDLFDRDAPLSRHAHRVVLEITERASLESVPDVAERIAALRNMRYRVAVDDLGAGYAGLSYFATVSPDVVKIDMSLVRGIHLDAVKQRIVLAMVSLATTLGMEVVAEGVETADERDTVVRLGCHYLQGYAFARPAAPFPEARWD